MAAAARRVPLWVALAAVSVCGGERGAELPAPLRERRRRQRERLLRPTPAPTQGETDAACPQGSFLKGIAHVGLWWSGGQAASAVADFFTSQLRLPVVWTVLNRTGAGDNTEVLLARAVLLGDLPLVVWSPSLPAIALAACAAAQLTVAELVRRRVTFRTRPHLSWAWEVGLRWSGPHAPAVYVCRSPDCVPLGKLGTPELREDPSDRRVRNWRQFRARYQFDAVERWEAARVVATAQKAAQKVVTGGATDLELRRASHRSVLGPTVATSVHVFAALNSTRRLARLAADQGRLLPLPGGPRGRSAIANCSAGCRWVLPSGPSLVVHPSRGGAELRAVRWATDDLRAVRRGLAQAGALDEESTRSRCARLSLRRLGIDSHTAVFLCPRSRRSRDEAP
eukprot:TRINITY_DN45423_c0_g1_i2.p1 TRINITY_DN45423_c0_g1~~TRINITY_DN45423_c0_g1_i2.p1  ORF type:complete len:396 (+),score=87.87 TRINITY_DN45423_c0_g1_i2:64-1251(+)